MQLFILRHGDAPFDANDAERALSQRGKEDTKRVLLARQSELSRIQHIVCSPIRRARETLRVFINILDYKGKLSFEDCLRSAGPINAVADFVNHSDEQAILLISHQPLVGQILNFLADESGLGHRMGTSCLACFDTPAFSRGAGEFRWLETP